MKNQSYLKCILKVDNLVLSTRYSDLIVSLVSKSMAQWVAGHTDEPIACLPTMPGPGINSYFSIRYHIFNPSTREIKTNKNPQRFLWGAALRIHAWEPLVRALLYFRDTLFITETALEHRNHGRKKA